MPKRLLDTNAVSACMQSQVSLSDYLKEGAPDDPAFTSVIVEGELRFGIARLPDGHRRHGLKEAMDQILEQLEIIPVTSEVAQRYAATKAELLAQGRTVGEHDLWIAVTALTHDCSVITKDEAFKLVPGLTVESW